MDAVVVTGQCARSACARDATISCPTCHEVPTQEVDQEHPPAFYCDRTCLVEDAPAHENACNDRQCLHRFLRAANLLSTIWLIFLEDTYSFPLPDDCTRVGRTLRFHGPALCPLRRPSGYPFRPLPTSVREDAVEKQAVLCLLECSSSLALMYELTKAMLQGKSCHCTYNPCDSSWLRIVQCCTASTINMRTDPPCLRPSNLSLRSHNGQRSPNPLEHHVPRPQSWLLRRQQRLRPSTLEGHIDHGQKLRARPLRPSVRLG